MQCQFFGVYLYYTNKQKHGIMKTGRDIQKQFNLRRTPGVFINLENAQNNALRREKVSRVMEFEGTYIVCVMSDCERMMKQGYNLIRY